MGIHHLIAMCNDYTIEEADLLTAAGQVIPRRFDDQFSKWRDNELFGYLSEEEVPDYRRLEAVELGSEGGFLAPKTKKPSIFPIRQGIHWLAPKGERYSTEVFLCHVGKLTSPQYMLLEHHPYLQVATAETNKVLKIVRDRVRLKAYEFSAGLDQGVLEPTGIIEARATNVESTFFNAGRLAQLRSLKTPLDTRKLIRLCGEINESYACGNYMAVIFLARAFLDHVAPYFPGCTSFNNVVNNYKGPDSFNRATKALQDGLRHIADYTIHQRAGLREELPNRDRVSFAPQFDWVLAHLIEINS